MSARAAADGFVERWRGGGYGFGIINFANPDMVGHTGVIPAAVAAVEAVGTCLCDVLAAVHEKGGARIGTAGHGNAAPMLAARGTPYTAPLPKPGPRVVTSHVPGLREGGILADVAPTVLHLLGMEQPGAMTGTSLLPSPHGDAATS